MIDRILNPLRQIKNRRRNGNNLDGFYKIRIVNRSKHVIWLAKNTVGDLHDIIPSGRSLEIRLPVAQKMEFYAYKASNNLTVTGLDYYAKREFINESTWVID